jgi:hypothetical protein
VECATDSGFRGRHLVIYMVLTVAFLVSCAGLGLARGRAEMRILLPATLAAAMVCAQFALLMAR